MAQFEQHFVQDLTQPIKVRHCGTIVFNADDESNVISVRLFNGSEPVAISGSVVGAVVCSDGSTVTLSGSYSGNTASITLTGDCFAILGQIGVGIQIVNGTQKTTVLKAIYNVETLTTENVVDPGSRITLEVGDLIDDIETAVASIPADYSDLLAAIAPNYSGLTFPVKAGTFCWYDGTLYQAQQDIATSEAWTAAHWASSVLTTSLDEKLADVDDELGDLKSTSENEFNKIKFATITSESAVVTEDISDSVTLSDGYMSLNGTPTASTSYKYTNKIRVSPGDVLSRNSGLSDYRFVTAYSGNTAVEASGTTFASVYTVPNGINGVVLSLYNDAVGVDGSIMFKHTTEIYKNLQNYVTPEMYGAKGDGITNDTSALSSALNSGKIVCLVSGREYLVTSTIDINDDFIELNGNEATIKYTGTGTCFNFVTPETGVKTKDYIHNVQFVGPNRTTENDAIATMFNGNRTLNTIEHCTFTDWGTAIKLSGEGSGVAAYGSLIYNCDFWHVNDCAIYANKQAEQLQIDHCWINYGINASNSCGIRIYNSTSTIINDCVVQAVYNGIELRGCKPATITNCHFEVCSHYSIYMKSDQYQNEEISVIGCYIMGGNTGIMMENGTEGKTNNNPLFLNNIFTGQSSKAIDVINNISNTNAIIIGCYYATDHNGATDLIGPSVKYLQFSKASDGNATIVNNGNVVAKFVGDTLHLKNDPVIDLS